MGSERLKKVLTLILFAGFFVLFLGIKLCQNVTDLDELWNLNFGIQVSKGLIPYKNISMIMTPLAAWLSGGILAFVPYKLLAFRILTAILYLAILIATYKIINRICDKTMPSLLATAVIGLIYMKQVVWDYNYLTLFLFLIAIYLEMTREFQSDGKDFAIGFVAGLCILTKQTLGIAITFAFLVDRFFICKHRIDVKETIRTFFFRALGAIIPVAGFVIYLFLTNSMNDFISYTIKGLKTFSNHIKYSELLHNGPTDTKFWAIMLIFYIILGILSIILNIIVNVRKTSFKKLFKISNNDSQEEVVDSDVKSANIDDEFIKNKIIILLILSFATLIGLYPIADQFHFYSSVLPSFITAFAAIILVADKTMKQELIERIIYGAEIALNVFIALVAVYNASLYIKRYAILPKNNVINEYKYLIEDKNQIAGIQNVDDFIKNANSQGYDVCIADADAALYTIPLNQYHKNFDMFNKGNLGAGGENGIIKKIQQSKNTLYLIKGKNYRLNWQSPTQVLAYIRANLTQIGVVGQFDVFKTN